MAGLRGKVLGGYQLGDQLQGGGIAEVYRARPMKPGGREAVVKVIYPEFARQPGFLPNFRSIVERSGKLVSHPHILPVLASGEDNGYLYLVSPYVAEGTLRDWMQRGGRFGAADVAPFFRQLCGALAHAHSLGLTHGNIKPSNIFLFEGRHVLLGDFGMLWDVRHLDMNHSGSGTEAVEYLAPECFTGGVTQQGDIYSVGALLFATLTGTPPFRGSKPADVYLAHSQRPVPHLVEAAPQLPAPVLALDAVIQRAMAKRPEMRFPAAMEVPTAIEAALRSAPQSVPPPSRAVSAPLGGAAGQPGVQPLATIFQAGGMPNLPGMPSPLAARGVAAPGVGGASPASFPPLPASAQIDSAMESGRYTVGRTDTSAQPTLRVSAPPGAPVRSNPNLDLPVTTRVPAPQSAPPAFGGAGLGGDFAAPQWGAGISAPGPASLPGASGERPGEMQAIRLPHGGPDLSAPFVGGAQARGGAAWGGGMDDGFADELAGGHLPAVSPGVGNGQPSRRDASPSAPRHDDDYSAEYPVADFAGSRVSEGFSPTELGLPRLTVNELASVPAGWENSYSEEVPVAARYSRQEHASAGWSEAMPATASAPRGRGNPFDIDNTGDAGSPSNVFGDSHVWTNGRTAARKPRHWRRVVVLVVLLVVLVDTGLLVVLRPDLCPGTVCRDLNARIRAAVPALASVVQEPPPAFTSNPDLLALATTVDHSAQGTLTLVNTAKTPATWHASTGLPWIAVSPDQGVTEPGAEVTLTITATATKVTPGPYATDVSLSTHGGTLTFPVTVRVGLGPHLKTPDPAKLTFSTCGTAAAQTIRLQNDGDAPVTFTATASKSGVLSLSVTSGTIQPGATTDISVSPLCPAFIWPNQYSVVLTSDGGNPTVGVSFVG